MKTFVLLFLLLIPFLTINAQQSIVSGKVVDKNSKEDIPYVTVSVISKEKGTIIASMMTDDKGQFTLSDLHQGEYIAKFSYVGYLEKSLEFFIGDLNPIYNIGKIELTGSPQLLGEIQIIGQRQHVNQALDKKIFDISNNISQSGGSVLDAMSNMPGISVDQDGKVLLRGSDKVAILIDGKQSVLTGFGNQKGLDNIAASNIDRIEIINNPSAKYDAAGMAGIINIIYKKEHQTGFNGNAGFTFGLGALTKRKSDLPSTLGSYNFNTKYIPSLNLNYKSGNINVFLQTEIIRQRHLPNNEFTTRYYDDGTSVISQIPENRTQTHYLIKGGIDWILNERNTLSFSGLYDYESHVDKADVTFFNNMNMDPLRNWQWDEHENTGLASAAVSFKHRFADPGHELHAALQYTCGWENEKYRLREISLARIGEDTTHVIAKEHITQLTMDYTKPLFNGRIEAGMKGQIRRLPVTYNVYRGHKSVIYPGLGNWSDWGEDMAAFYANWIFEKKKIDIEMGLRTEYTRVFYDISSDNIYYPSNDAYDYWNLFPNIRLTWKMNEANRLSVFYNRRVDRPGEAELRIFPKYDDPELLKVGNPYLRPQYTHNLELAYKYIWNSGSIFFGGYYKIIKDPYSRIYAIDEHSVEHNIINKIYENTGKAKNTGIELIFDQQVNSFWKITGSINWYHNHIAGYDGILYFPYERPFSISESNDNTWYAKLNSLFYIGKGRQVQLSGVYYAAQNIAQGRRSGRGGIDIGFRQTFYDDRIELLFSMKDILSTMGIKEEIYNQGFKAVYENYYETQIASLGLNFKF